MGSYIYWCQAVNWPVTLNSIHENHNSLLDNGAYVVFSLASIPKNCKERSIASDIQDKNINSDNQIILFVSFSRVK